MANKYRRTRWPWHKDMPDELVTAIENAKTDGVEGWNTLEFALEEARYIIDTFSEGGHANYEWLRYGDPEDREEARAELRKLKKFVNKYQGRNK